MKRAWMTVALFLIAVSAKAQTVPPPGFPLYGSFESLPGAGDSINRQDLNSNFQIPIISKKARGLNLSFSLAYNSLLWEKNGTAWSLVPYPDGSPGWSLQQISGYVTFQSTSTICHPVGASVHAYNYAYVEPNGTQHPLPLNFTTSCSGKMSGTTSGYATDSSGYYAGSYADVITDPSGIQIKPQIQVMDTNGNYMTQSTGMTDSTGAVALKITTGSSSDTYQYQDTTGTYRTITVALQNYNLKTNFGCSGVSEFTGGTTFPLPSSVTLPNGLVYSFTYEQTPGNSGYTTGRISKITLPDGGYIQYAFGGSNDGINCSNGNVLNLTRTIYDGTNSYVWQFNVSGGATTVTAPQMPWDSTANNSVYTFNSSGQETSEQLYQGAVQSSNLLRTINTTWASNNTPATRTTILEDNSTQSEIETSYDSYGNLLSLKEHDYGSGSPGPILRTTTYTYLNTSAYTALNIMDRVTQETVSDSSGTIQYVEQTAYDGTTISPCPTGVVQHDDTGHGCSFSTRGNPTSSTTYTNASAPSGGVTKNSYYDVFGNLARQDADCCETMSWNFSATTEYSAPDSVVRGPSGTQLSTSYSYNAYTDQIASITDPNNQTTSFAYDLMLRPTTTTRPDSSQIVVSYNDTNHTSTSQNPIQGSSVVNNTSYLDGLSRAYKTSIFDGSNNLYSTTTIQYDGMGRAYNTSNPYTSSPQYWTETTFDALGRGLKVILADGSTATRSYSLNSMTTTDPVGNQRKFLSDGLNRLSVTYEPDPTNSNSLTLQSNYSYTVLDQLATLTQGSQTRTFSFDGMGRLTGHTLPESGTTSFQYNSYNQISQRTDARGVITTFTYDSMNRIYQISYNVGSTGVAATPTITYTYGTNASQLNNGRILTLSDGLGTTTYTYDNLGRATQAQSVINGSTYTIGRQYNFAGEVTSLTYPSGRVVQRTYDAIGRLASIADSSATYVNSLSYNTAQERTNFNYGNGVAATIGYSPDRLQKQSIKFAGSSTVYNVSYSRMQNGGNNGEITSITDSVDSGRSINYTYDSLGRLSTAQTTGDASYPQWGLSFAYDRYGNRLGQTVTAGTAPSTSVAVSATTNRISSPGYSYDTNGNVTNDGSNALAYDAENRLLSASGPYGAGAYSYGAFGNRAVKSSGGNTTVSIYYAGRVIAEYANGTLANEYIYMGNHLVASQLSGTLYYSAFDHQSIRVLLDGSGNVAGQKGHYPFGEDWYPTGLTNRHFTSYVRDSESLNDNAVHRFYVNRLGQFSSTDPQPGGGGNPQAFNLYNYAHNDPVNFRDPSGKFTIVLYPGGTGGGGGDDDDDDDSGGGCDPTINPYCDNGCDPTVNPTCGNCNPSPQMEGNPCPPEPTEPPQPTVMPSCSGKLYYRPVQFTGGVANHAFWIVTDEDFFNWTLEGGPNHGGIFGTIVAVFGFAKLMDWDLQGTPPDLPHFKADTPAANQFLSFGGPNVETNVCPDVDTMTAVGMAFPNGQLFYNAFSGPNSNSVAHAFGNFGGILNPTSPGPPRTPGWNFYLTW